MSRYLRYEEALKRKKEHNTCADNSSGLYVSNLEQTGGGSCMLLVDPQNDFIVGSLKVPGAVADCRRIGEFLRANIQVFQEIYVTLDTHMKKHIAHPGFWYIGGTKEHPKPFTQITRKDVMEGKFVPVDERHLDWVKEYTLKLEVKSRLDGLAAFVLTVWPEHCLIGTPGHNVHPEIMSALKDWEDYHNKCVHYIIKGNNSLTEHYSAFRAEVIRSDDPRTKFNKVLYEDLARHAKIYVAGQAKSHCVNFTVRDLVDRIGTDNAGNKVVLMDGGMSNVQGCDAEGNKFWDDMTLPKVAKTPGGKTGLGMTVVDLKTTTEIRALGNGLRRADFF